MTIDNLKVPAFCPICEMIMRGSKSVSSYYDYGCCSACFIQFVEGREQRWKDGWRPERDAVAAFVKNIGG